MKNLKFQEAFLNSVFLLTKVLLAPMTTSKQSLGGRWGKKKKNEAKKSDEEIIPLTLNNFSSPPFSHQRKFTIERKASTKQILLFVFI